MVTIDCADPRRLAAFWSAALGVACRRWTVLADAEGNPFCVGEHPE